MSNSNDVGILTMPKSNARKHHTEKQWIEEYTAAFQGKQAEKILIERRQLESRIIQIEQQEKEIAKASLNKDFLEQTFDTINTYLFPNTSPSKTKLQKELCELEKRRLSNMKLDIFNCTDNTFRTESELSTLESSAKHLVTLRDQTFSRVEKLVYAWNNSWNQTKAMILRHDPNNVVIYEKLRGLTKELQVAIDGVDLFISEYKHNLPVANETIDESPLKNTILSIARAVVPRELRSDNLICKMLNKTLVGRGYCEELLHSDSTHIPCQKPEIKRKQRIPRADSPYRSRN